MPFPTLFQSPSGFCLTRVAPCEKSGRQHRMWSMRAVLSLTLIATLLICPYRCQGSLGSVCAAESAPAACSCCQRCAASSESATGNKARGTEDRPSSPSDNDDCSCGNCLCHGAVSEESDFQLDQQTLTAVAITFEVSLLELLSERTGWDDGPPVSIARAGRTLRLSIHSLQI